MPAATRDERRARVPGRRIRPFYQLRRFRRSCSRFDGELAAADAELLG
jgi:hypothetical protein